MKKQEQEEDDDEDDDEDQESHEEEDDEDEDDSQEDDDGEDDVLVKPKVHREHKRHVKSWRQSLQAKRMAEDSKNPRKSLLKGKKVRPFY